jgi:hypothetical protein
MVDDRCDLLCIDLEKVEALRARSFSSTPPSGPPATPRLSPT